MRSALVTGALLLLTAAVGGCRGDDEPAVTEDAFCTEAQALEDEGLAGLGRGDAEETATYADMAGWLDRMAEIAPSSLEAAFEVVTEADITGPESFADPQVASALSEIVAYLESECGLYSQDTTNETVAVSACAELLPEGTILGDDMFDLYCIGETGSAETHTAEVSQCVDGRSLYRSDLGWGYVGEPWHATAEPPAAELAACLQ